MRTIFLADAHLDGAADENYCLLIRFLATLKGNTETLFIMGDLFDFWLGFPSQPFSQYDAILDALLDLTRSGCRIVYFEGNHDFHMGPVFRERLSAEVHTGPAVMSVQGKRLYLCHGDQINKADHGYRMLRLMLHNPLAAAAIAVFPPRLAYKIKERLQRASKAGYQSKTGRWDYREVVRSFARTVQQNGCDGLVTGHFHLACCEKLDDSPFTLLALGDWMKQYTYGEMIGGELFLKKYDF